MRADGKKTNSLSLDYEIIIFPRFLINVYYGVSISIRVMFYISQYITENCNLFLKCLLMMISWGGWLLLWVFWDFEIQSADKFPVLRRVIGWNIYNNVTHILNV